MTDDTGLNDVVVHVCVKQINDLSEYISSFIDNTYNTLYM